MAKIREVYLSYDENAALRSALRHVGVSTCAEAIAAIPALQEALLRSITPGNAQAIASFPHSDACALIVHHLPVDEPLPPTPYDVDPQVADCPIVHSAILAAFGCMGIHPVAYQGESDDSVFRHVAPKLHAQLATSSHGSRLQLGMHVDNPHLPLACEQVEDLSACPEYLSLMGVRCEVNVPTRLVDLRQVLKNLPQFVHDALRRPHFTIQRPESFAQSDLQRVAPILVQGQDDAIFCRYNKANVRGRSPEAAAALEIFEAAASAPDYARQILLQQGDLLVFKNQRVLHARNRFRARFDGTDRWMIRVFGVSDLARTIPVADKPYIVRA